MYNPGSVFSVMNIRQRYYDRQQLTCTDCPYANALVKYLCGDPTVDPAPDSAITGEGNFPKTQFIKLNI